MATWSDDPGAKWRLPPPTGESFTSRRADCPRYFITATSYGGDEYSVDARTPTGKRAGYISLMRYGLRELQVMMSKVYPEHRSCGLGTRLYEEAAKLACTHGARLASDDKRSVMSQRFWEKQVRKGRAVCVRKAPEYTGTSQEPERGRGGCEYYRLLDCPAGELSGRRRTKKRRPRHESPRGRRR